MVGLWYLEIGDCFLNCGRGDCLKLFTIIYIFSHTWWAVQSFATTFRSAVRDSFNWLWWVVLGPIPFLFFFTPSPFYLSLPWRTPKKKATKRWGQYSVEWAHFSRWILIQDANTCIWLTFVNNSTLRQATTRHWSQACKEDKDARNATGVLNFLAEPWWNSSQTH